MQRASFPRRRGTPHFLVVRSYECVQWIVYRLWLQCLRVLVIAVSVGDITLFCMPYFRMYLLNCSVRLCATLWPCKLFVINDYLVAREAKDTSFFLLWLYCSLSVHSLLLYFVFFNWHVSSSFLRWILAISLFFPFLLICHSISLLFDVGHFLLLLFISLFLYCVLYIPLFIS